jgi:Collagen triple helix repeat (20 copies)
MEFVRRHLSYANVVATIAMVFAMSGGALAATHYLINSTKQINPKVLNALRAGTGTDGAKGTNGANGANGSSGPSGAQGAQGIQGPQGSQGPAGSPGEDGPKGAPGNEGKEGGSGVIAWESLTASITQENKVAPVSGFEPPAVRTESGGRTARLRGVLEVKNTVEHPTEALFIIPASERPCKNLEFGDGVEFGGGSNHVGSLAISAATGAVTDPETPVPAGNRYLLDGITWDVPLPGEC